MNILEHYIEEIHSVKPYAADWAVGEWVEVDITSNCYGNTKRENRVLTIKQWETAKENGYYMAQEGKE